MTTASKQTQIPAANRNDPRWAMLMARTPAADSLFLYSVSSTGVYCRPSCPARLARPEHVQFHNSCADAERAGFRPCKRCKPNQPSLKQQYATKITAACRAIENSETVPTLGELAKQTGLSPFHFHRVFKSITGVTPKSYAVAHRATRVRAELGQSTTVTAAIFGAGYNSSARFYDKSDGLLGMTPTKFRAGGTNTTIRFAIGKCTLGAILVAASERGVCAISLDDDPEKLAREFQDRFPRAELIGGDRQFERWVSQVVGYVDDPTIGLDLPLDIRGTAFQQRVWQALRDIPIGSTATYTEVAKRIGAPKSARAVARACASNVLAIAIPCHRVVRTDGSLSGYRWGIERKRKLLKIEVL